MAKYYGKIGFVETMETSPGIHEEVITERNYYGDTLKNSYRFQSSEHLNDNLNVSNRISIIGDIYAWNKWPSIRYAEFHNALWKVTDVEVEPPRLLLTIGGLYNG